MEVKTRINHGGSSTIEFWPEKNIQKIHSKKYFDHFHTKHWGHTCIKAIEGTFKVEYIARLQKV